MSNITLPRAEAEQIRQALASGKRLYAALAALDAALAEPKETFAESLFRRSWEAHRAALAEPVAEQHPEKGPALTVYNEIAATDDPGSPLERLRFFCSLAMRPQDWLDVAPFFDAVAEPEQGNCADGSCGCCWTDKPEPVHPGYIIGAHWLETAYSRIAAGEAEDAVLAEVLGARGWAKREPATEKKVLAAYGATLGFFWSDYRTGWQAAERFHGIGKENKT